MRGVSPAVCTCVAMLMLVTAALAQSATEPLKAVMAAQKIVLHDGVETKQPATSVKPGDLVEYTVEYRNESSHALRNVQGMLPIPNAMVYVSGSANPKGALASTDGKNFAPMPLKKKEKQANGSEMDVPVPLKAYRALRWDLGEIAPNSSKTVRARVQVLTTP